MPVPNTDIKALRTKRAQIVADAQAILAKDEMTAEEEARFDTLMTEADKLKAKIDRHERANDAEADLNREIERSAGREQPGGEGGSRGNAGDGGPSEEAKKEYHNAFRNYLRFGLQNITPEEQKVLRAGYKQDAEMRAPQSTTTTAGGYTIPQGFLQRLDEALKEYGGVKENSFNLNTGSGAQMLWPTLDDTSNKATLVAENAQSSETALTFGQKQLDAYMYRSMVLVSLELLQDSGFDLDTIIPRLLGERLARGLNTHFTIGTGSSQPNGVVTASNGGATADASNAVSYDDLVDLEHALNPAYRARAKFMMADSTLKLIKQLKDSQNRPLWLPGLAVKEPDTILGKPYFINEDMATVEASAKSIVFGDFSRYIVRNVTGSYILMRLSERYADYGQVGFILFSRHDAELASAQSTTLNPMQHLVHPSP